MSDQVVWQLDGHAAALRSESWPLNVDLLRPELGLTSSADAVDREILLGVRFRGFPDPIPPSTLVDAYVRQNDLIVTFDQVAPEHLRAQIYYRYLRDQSRSEISSNSPADTQGEGLQLFLSLQTDRLDSYPQVDVVLRAPVDEVLQRELLDGSSWRSVTQSLEAPPRLAPPLFVLRTAQDPALSLVLMVASSDVAAWRINRPTDTNRADVELQLFHEHLEKGVIRRGQLAVWRVPRTDDCRRAEQLHAQFLTAPPPLTT
jgi:hypothetical protein